MPSFSFKADVSTFDKSTGPLAQKGIGLLVLTGKVERTPYIEMTMRDFSGSQADSIREHIVDVIYPEDKRMKATVSAEILHLEEGQALQEGTLRFETADGVKVFAAKLKEAGVVEQPKQFDMQVEQVTKEFLALQGHNRG